MQAPFSLIGKIIILALVAEKIAKSIPGLAKTLEQGLEFYAKKESSSEIYKNIFFQIYGFSLFSDENNLIVT